MRYPKRLKRLKRALKTGVFKRKYNNEYTLLDGIRFHSKAESKRYAYLSQNSKVLFLQRQVPYLLKQNKYVADFVYNYDGKTIIEDVKHPLLLHTKKTINNRKEMREIYGLEVTYIKPEFVHLPYYLASYKL